MIHRTFNGLESVAEFEEVTATMERVRETGPCS